MTRTVLRVLAGGILTLVSFMIGVVFASTSYSLTYSRSTMATYADRYSCNGTQCRNSSYPSFGSDCTNFASQAVRVGGFPNDGIGTWTWWYSSTTSYTKSWSVVSDFRSYMINDAHASYLSVTMGDAYSPATKGDLYLYNWGRGDGYSHISLSPGYGYFPSYYDASYARNYTSVTGGRGDWLDQHSTDRYHAPWNWGYQTETDPTVKSRMRTLVIHFNY